MDGTLHLINNYPYMGEPGGARGRQGIQLYTLGGYEDFLASRKYWVFRPFLKRSLLCSMFHSLKGAKNTTTTKMLDLKNSQI